MPLKLRDWFVRNRKLIMLTFEIFWIVVFLLNRIANENLVEMPQFIYVNF
jgi:hypothetical protein